jgi:hypothetical protein
MSQYRSSNLININKTQVVIKRPPVKAPQPVYTPHVTPVRHTIPPKRTAVVASPAPVVSPVHPQRHVRPVGIKVISPQTVQQRIVKPNNRQLSSAENQRRIANRPKETNIEAYRDNILRLKGMGQGRILIVLACGPSVNEIPVEKLVGDSKIDIMCINKPNPRVWPSKYWTFCDQTQYSHNLSYWEKYSGTIINAASVRARHRNQTLIRNLSGTGFSKDLMKGFYIGRSTTYASMQIALWMNYPHVFIFGCDMAAVDGKLHYYGQNPDVGNANRIERFKQEGESYSYAAKNLLQEERDRFTFCSNYNKFDFIKSFKSLDHTTAVDKILELAKSIR